MKAFEVEVQQVFTSVQFAVVTVEAATADEAKAKVLAKCEEKYAIDWQQPIDHSSVEPAEVIEVNEVNELLKKS